MQSFYIQIQCVSDLLIDCKSDEIRHFKDIVIPMLQDYSQCSLI